MVFIILISLLALIIGSILLTLIYVSISVIFSAVILSTAFAINVNREPIHLAVLDNDLEYLESCSNEEINKKDYMGNTPLQLAAKSGNIEILRAILAKNPANSENENGNTALHLAAFRGHEECVEELVNYFPKDINKKNNLGRAPLHLACLKKRYESVNKLLQKGADINIKDRKGNTVLHIAAIKKDLDMLKLLFKFPNINILIKNAQGYNALEACKNIKNSNKATIKFLESKYR